METIQFIIKSSIEPRVLEHVAKYIIKKKLESVHESGLETVIKAKCASMLNSHVPDIESLFKNEVKMDLSEPDIEARLVKHYVDLEQIVEEKGLRGVLSRSDEVTDASEVVPVEKLLKCRR